MTTSDPSIDNLHIDICLARSSTILGQNILEACAARCNLRKKSFQLTREEYESLRSQIVILKAGRGAHRKYLPYVFTEHGAVMLSPRVACKNTWARVEALQRNQAFIDRYREARADHLAGREAIFPAGTWWLHRFAGVKCAELGATAPPS
jgi:hypothetical protein